jgi:hypothetical protein
VALDAGRAAVLCCSGYIPVVHGERLPAKYVERPPSLDELLRGECGIVLTSTIVMRAASFVNCGGFSAEFIRPGFEDTYMFLRLREHGEFRCLHETHVFYNSPSFSESAYKYVWGFHVFARLVRSRYGKSAYPSLRVAKNFMAASLLTRALEQMDGNSPAAAIRTLMRLVYFHPLSFLKNGNFKRLLRRRNFRRFALSAIVGGYRFEDKGLAGSIRIR